MIFLNSHVSPAGIWYNNNENNRGWVRISGRQYPAYPSAPLRGFRTKFRRNSKKNSEQQQQLQQQQSQQQSNTQKESSSSGNKKESPQLVSQNSFEHQTTMGKHEIKRGISHRSSDAGEFYCHINFSRRALLPQKGKLVDDRRGNNAMITLAHIICSHGVKKMKSIFYEFSISILNQVGSSVGLFAFA